MKRLCAGLGLWVTLTGCGGTVCDELGDAYAQVNDKARACLQEGDEAQRPFDHALCEANVGRCSNDERLALSQLADCFRAAPVCTPDTESNFNSAVFLCALDAADRVGNACLSILPDTASGQPSSPLQPSFLFYIKAARLAL